MVVVLVLILIALIDGAVLFIDSAANDLWNMVFNIKTVIPIATFSNIISSMQAAFYAAAVSLMIIKFLKKLFDIYVLSSEGDSSVNPLQLVVNFVKAMVVSLCFPYLWTIFVKVGKDLLDKSLAAMGGTGSLAESWLVKNLETLGIVPVIFSLVFIVMFLILYFKFMKRGLELAFMIVGMPLACIELLDNDKGMFPAYLNQFKKIIVTTLFQIVTFKLGFVLTMSWSGAFNPTGGLAWGIACLMLTMSVPSILQEFMLPTQGHGGGIMPKAYSVGMMVNLVKSAIK